MGNLIGVLVLRGTVVAFTNFHEVIGINVVQRCVYVLAILEALLVGDDVGLAKHLNCLVMLITRIFLT